MNDDDDGDRYLGMEAVNYGDSNGGDEECLRRPVCCVNESDMDEDTDDSIESILEVGGEGTRIYLEPQKGHGSSQMMCEEPLSTIFSTCHSHSDDELERAAVSEGLRSLSISA